MSSRLSRRALRGAGHVALAVLVLATPAWLAAPVRAADGAAPATSTAPAAATTVATDPKIARALKTTRILVVGSTGRNGSSIVEALEAAGARPRTMVRDLAKAKEKAGAGVQRDWVVGDLRDPASLDAALKGVTVVINAAATTQLQGENDTAAVDREGTRNLVDAAKRAGVKRIVFITGMSVYSPPPQMPPPMLKAFGDKREAEKILAASGLEYVTLRPTGILPRLADLQADARGADHAPTRLAAATGCAAASGNDRARRPRRGRGRLRGRAALPQPRFRGHAVERAARRRRLARPAGFAAWRLRPAKNAAAAVRTGSAQGGRRGSGEADRARADAACHGRLTP